MQHYKEMILNLIEGMSEDQLRYAVVFLKIRFRKGEK